MVNKKKLIAGKIFDIITFVICLCYIIVAGSCLLALIDAGQPVDKLWIGFLIALIACSVFLVTFIGVGFAISAKSKDGYNHNITAVALKLLFTACTFVASLLVYVKFVFDNPLKTQIFIIAALILCILNFVCLICNTMILGMKEVVEAKESKKQ